MTTWRLRVILLAASLCLSLTADLESSNFVEPTEDKILRMAPDDPHAQAAGKAAMALLSRERASRCPGRRPAFASWKLLTVRAQEVQGRLYRLEMELLDGEGHSETYSVKLWHVLPGQREGRTHPYRLVKVRSDPCNYQKLATTLFQAEQRDRLNGTWTARLHPHFEGMTLSEFQAMQGDRVEDEHLDPGAYVDLEDASHDEAYDVRKAKPGRWSTVLNQGLCGSCYAEAAVTAYAAYTEERSLEVSSQRARDCSPTACNGGHSIDVWERMVTLPLPEKRCVPNEKRGHADGLAACTKDQPCSAFVHSQNAKDAPLWRTAGKGYQYSSGARKLMTQVKTGGPVVVSMRIFDGFQEYAAGIFEPAPNAAFHGNHAAVLVGWGTDPITRKKYWTIQNSWSEHWGEAGFGRLIRDDDNDIFNLETNFKWPIVKSRTAMVSRGAAGCKTKCQNGGTRKPGTCGACTCPQSTSWQGYYCQKCHEPQWNHHCDRFDQSTCTMHCKRGWSTTNPQKPCRERRAGGVLAHARPSVLHPGQKLTVTFTEPLRDLEIFHSQGCKFFLACSGAPAPAELKYRLRSEQSFVPWSAEELKNLPFNDRKAILVKFQCQDTTNMKGARGEVHVRLEPSQQADHNPLVNSGGSTQGSRKLMTAKDFERAESDWKRADSDWNRAQSDWKRAQSDYKPGSADYNRARSDLKRAQSDWNRASSDFHRAMSDFHRSAKGDWNRAESDWKRAQSDWNRSQSDWNRSQSDYRRGSSDWNRAQSDWNRAQSDWNRAQSDWNRAQSDWNRAQSDWNRSQSDWSGAGFEDGAKPKADDVNKGRKKDEGSKKDPKIGSSSNNNNNNNNSDPYSRAKLDRMSKNALWQVCKKVGATKKNCDSNFNNKAKLMELILSARARDYTSAKKIRSKGARDWAKSLASQTKGRTIRVEAREGVTYVIFGPEATFRGWKAQAVEFVTKLTSAGNNQIVFTGSGLAAQEAESAAKDFMQGPDFKFLPYRSGTAIVF